ncbi:cyclodeaminase/cyclohydrolase family protein, partial [candidate division WOR-3 bacterium]|nr:cyclodeaminase/cyclohydrolase family protein [candidate division WOR-3 bacterium]
KNGIRLLEIACEMAKIGNRNALSDVAVATEMAMTAVKAGKENVEINLPMVDDDDTKDKIKQEADKLLQEANKLYSETIKEITKRKHENEG